MPTAACTSARVLPSTCTWCCMVPRRKPCMDWPRFNPKASRCFRMRAAIASAGHEEGGKKQAVRARCAGRVVRQGGQTKHTSGAAGSQQARSGTATMALPVLSGSSQNSLAREWAILRNRYPVIANCSTRQRVRDQPCVPGVPCQQQLRLQHHNRLRLHTYLAMGVLLLGCLTLQVVLCHPMEVLVL